MKIIRIGLVDDKIKLLSSLREKLSLYEDLEIVWAAGNSIETFRHLNDNPVDIILMDIEMPGMDGIELTSKIKAAYQNTKIIMLTVFDSNDKIFEAILAGASGYLLKDEKLEKLYQSIVEVLEGGAPMSPIMAYKALQLITNLHNKPGYGVKMRKGVCQEDLLHVSKSHDLTGREMEILQNLSKGLSYNEIAEILFISPKTVRNHIHNIYTKLQISSRYEAVFLAQQNNWV